MLMAVLPLVADMNRQIVQSSKIKSIGYDRGTKTLEIEFAGGGVFQYEAVPEYIYQSLMVAASKSQYFELFIRGQFASKT